MNVIFHRQYSVARSMHIHFHGSIEVGKAVENILHGGNIFACLLLDEEWQGWVVAGHRELGDLLQGFFDLGVVRAGNAHIHFGELLADRHTSPEDCKHDELSGANAHFNIHFNFGSVCQPARVLWHDEMPLCRESPLSYYSPSSIRIEVSGSAGAHH